MRIVARADGSFGSPSNRSVVSAGLERMRNQPNHPEVSPLFTANPIADVSLSIRLSVLPLALSPPPCCLLSVPSCSLSLLSPSLSLFLSATRATLNASHPVSLSLVQCHVPSHVSDTTVCLFAAALANPNRGWSVFALNLPLRETGPLESNKIRATVHGSV